MENKIPSIVIMPQRCMKMHNKPIIVLLWWTNIADEVPAQTIWAFEKSFTYLRTAADPQNSITECNNDPSRIRSPKTDPMKMATKYRTAWQYNSRLAEWQEIDVNTGICLLELEEQNMRVGGWLPVDVWAEKETQVILTHYMTHREGERTAVWIMKRFKRKPNNIYILQPYDRV